jgi:hypothetical protein
MRTWWRLAMPVVLGVATVAVVLLPALHVILTDEQLRDQGRRLMPELQLVPAACMGLTVGTISVFVLAMVKRGWPAARPRGIGFKIVYMMVSIVVQLGAMTFALAVMLFGNFHLFDDEYVHVKAHSAELGATAYLYTGGWECEHPIYVRQDGEVALREIGSVSGNCGGDERTRRLRIIPAREADDGHTMVVLEALPSGERLGTVWWTAAPPGAP